MKRSSGNCVTFSVVTLCAFVPRQCGFWSNRLRCILLTRYPKFTAKLCLSISEVYKLAVEMGEVIVYFNVCLNEKKWQVGKV